MSIPEAIRQLESSYRRKISMVEAEGDFFFVDKTHLDFFPKPNVEFVLRHRSKDHRVKVEPMHCECVKERPHKHYFVRVPFELKAGEGIEINKKEGKYHIVVRGEK